MASIEIKRGKGFKDAFRAYQIELNDEIVGSIKAGDAFEVDVQPGRHRLRMRIDWGSSAYLDFDIVEQQTLSFECGNNVPPFLELLYITLFRKKYLWLKQT